MCNHFEVWYSASDGPWGPIPIIFTPSAPPPIFQIVSRGVITSMKSLLCFGSDRPSSCWAELHYYQIYVSPRLASISSSPTGRMLQLLWDKVRFNADVGPARSWPSSRTRNQRGQPRNHKLSPRNQLAGLLVKVRHTLFRRCPGEYVINFLINTKSVFARQAPLVLFI